MSANPEKILLTIDDIRTMLQISKTTWYELIKSNENLKPLKIGRSSRWKRSTIETYVDELKS